MEGSLCHELETDLPAADLWEVYGGLLVGQLVTQLLPQLFSKVEVLDGDGDVSTALLVTFAPAPGTDASSGSCKDKFIKIDNENYVKESEVIEGGFLDLGFRKYLVRFEIIRKEDKTSIIRSTVEYEVDEEHISNASLVSTRVFASIAEATVNDIKDQKSSRQAPETEF
ncbi:hypothetical protein PAHAL_2G169700 [Panicum hallii]|uniref:Bet v I/Major latex protein domain-containing protein n=1 Tax=Panicum hallii TaxID=206008 RepID=A0A2S3GYD3_9POAL|nr:S-norcoclaurine synthase-like [Panicum hallii]PAN11505.1 hypothetical protein PAHAL_2G169700 [Panicum hallii]